MGKLIGGGEVKLTLNFGSQSEMEEKRENLTSDTREAQENFLNLLVRKENIL